MDQLQPPARPPRATLFPPASERQRGAGRSIRRRPPLPDRNLEAEVAPLVDNTLAPEERRAFRAPHRAPASLTGCAPRRQQRLSSLRGYRDARIHVTGSHRPHARFADTGQRCAGQVLRLLPPTSRRPQPRRRTIPFVLPPARIA